MTSPRQRKKMAALLAKKNKLENVKLVAPKVEQKPVAPVATATPPVVESETSQQLKVKKPLGKNALVETKTEETKPVDQVVEQPKEEVKTQTKE